MDSRKQLEKDVLTLFKEKEELRMKLTEAVKMARFTATTTNCRCLEDMCDGPTLGMPRLVAVA